MTEHDVPPSPGPKRPFAAGLAFLVVALATLVHLDQPALWADEAETAAMSRNVLLHGVPVGSDGRNLLTYDNCGQLGQGLVSKRVPWVQYYVGAASLALFGESTRGARMLFAILGALTFFPLLSLIRGRVSHPALVSALLLLAPQVVLFQRNARYYPLLILLSVSFLALLYAHRGRRRARAIGLGALAILLFHTHPLMATGFLLASVMASACVDRARLPVTAGAALAGFVSWAIWYVALPGLDGDQLRFTDLITADPVRWFGVFARGWAFSWIDFDLSGVLPLGAVIALLGFAAWKRLPELEEIVRDPLVVVIAFDFLIQTLATSAIVGAESRHHFALLRYMPHSFVLLGMAVARLVRTATGPGLREPAVLALLLASNLFGVAYWITPLADREVPLSWWPAVYGEIAAARPDPAGELFEHLGREAQSRDDVVYVSPEYAGDWLTFYVGGDVRIHPFVEPGSFCEEAVLRVVGRESWTESTKPPRFAVAFETREVDVPEGFERVTRIPTGRSTPTATRPALNRRDFFDAKAPGGSWALYRVLEDRESGADRRSPSHGIVLITLDTARGDLFDWEDPSRFPHTKALFAEGMRFDQAISASPVTAPAHASLFTGLDVRAHGVLSNHSRLEEEVTTIAELFRQAGYRTGGFVSASILARGRGFEQGFEHYDSAFEARYAEGHFERDAMRTTSSALAWLTNGDARPFFLWVHYFDAHAPYRPPADFRPKGLEDVDGRDPRFPDVGALQRIHREERPPSEARHAEIRALYEAQLDFVDAEIGRLRAGLEARHPQAELHFALAADHGEELGDHMNFYEHNLSLYDGVLRVPLAIAGPGVESKRVAEQVDPAGLARTLLGFAGIEAPSDMAADLLQDRARASERVANKELHAAVRPFAIALRAPPWKLHYWEDGRVELYDLERDPGERHDLSQQRPEVRDRLRARVEAEILPGFDTPAMRERMQREVDPETRDMLRALGYL